LNIFSSGSTVFSIREIERFYPDEWVAIAVMETDADGFASKGEIIIHDSDERFVWSAARLGNADDLVYVFFTGSRRTVKAFS
jgi:hypothetical protein